MFCGPKTEYPFTGFWNHNYECKWSQLTWHLLLILYIVLIVTSDIHHIDAHEPLLLTSLSGNKSWANPPESCDVYEDQKAGKVDNSAPYANTGESAERL